MFRIEMLPAQQGDALWIEYGDAAEPSRVLIDAGTPPTYAVVKERIQRLPPSARQIELLIVTHIDTDHIGGVLKLAADGTVRLDPAEVWFNAWRHLDVNVLDRLGPVDGEILSELIDRTGWNWNQAFGGGPAVVPDTGPLPVFQLPGGMTLTLLSPGPGQLLNLRRNWSRVVQNAGLDPSQPGRAMEILARLASKKGVRLDRLGGGRLNVEHLAESAFIADRSEANGSTIAVLAEFDGKSALLAGDGFAEVIAANVRRLVQARGREKLAIDALKLPHHGSKHNVDADLLALMSCRRYLFSTNGAIFGHPDPEAVAQVITKGGGDPRLYFNYRTEINSVWDDRTLKRDFGYETVYPAADSFGITIEL